MSPGQVYPVTVTWKNTGGSTWTVAAGHKMGSQNPENNFNWGMHRVDLPGTTAPGANAAFSWNVTAPTTPGTYNFQWRTAQSGVEWFGAFSTNAVVKVGLDNAAFVSQTVPAAMVAGQSYQVSVTMQNTGSTTWAAGTVGLGSQNPQGNTSWGPSKVNLTAPVAPSAQTTFTFDVTAPSAPGWYNFQWKMVEGTNGWFGAQSTNVPIIVDSNAPEANVYFIHTDHLNTPRLIANSSGVTVWRWDQQEPFGANPPDENPSSLGVFEFPLRYPGQYFDKETNLHYNYRRDYDPGLGRYVESDPLGLAGGDLSLYSYVGNSPLAYIDPFGLATTIPSPGIPGPGTPAGSLPGQRPGGSGLPSDLDPNQPRPRTFPTIRVPPFPPSSPPPQGRSICDHLFNQCVKGAEVCPPPVAQVARAFCLAAYIVCITITSSGGSGGDPTVTP